MPDPRAKYRIQSVAEMTGVPAATLRAWERRYGIPVPARTASSYRVYSDVDVEMIQRLRKLCDGGMSPSEAARLVLDDAEHVPVLVPLTQVVHDDPFEPTRTGLMRAVESFDPRRLERELDRATALGTAATIVEQVFRPVLVEIGTAWHEGRMTVAQEHLATESITSVTRRLLNLVQPDGDAPTILVACFADDDHGFAVLALAVHLATWGWRVVSLGPRTPPSAIGHAVTQLRPDLVGLSCSVAPTAHRARELVEGYADAIGDRPWLVGGAGGRAISDLIIASGGHVADETNPRALRAAIERVASAKHPARRQP